MRLDTQIKKWFIDIDNNNAFPPTHRVTNSKLKNYTTGNKVEVLLDGVNLMKSFHNQLEMISCSATPSKYKLWISAMNIQPVKLLGKNDKNKDIKKRLLELAEKGVQIRYLGGGHTGVKTTSTDFGRKLKERGSYGTADMRSAFKGGQHQKYTILIKPDNELLCTLGSADFFKANWDKPGHAEEDKDRPSDKPVHNLSVKVEGPATNDIALTFAERWNDIKSNHLTKPPIVRKVQLDFLKRKPTQKGPLAIQVLRTYGMAKKMTSYSFAEKGEFTVWASYINAIKKAKKYIYIEDQYLYPFGFPPVFDSGTDQEKDSDIIYQLGEALKRGVHVICLAPGRNNSTYKQYEIRHRQRGAHYLQKISSKSKTNGSYILAKLTSGKKDPVVHSKVMLIDDELSLIGSTNIGMIAMTAVSESHLAILDKDNKFTRELRELLWREHMNLSPNIDLSDCEKSIRKFIRYTKSKKGHLAPLSTAKVEGKDRHSTILKKIEPYKGPIIN